MSPHAIWKGAISFGLVSIPVKLFAATQELGISFRQIHPADEGRIRYKRICDTCGEEIPYAEIGKGYPMPDGRMVVLDAEDFEHLPLASARSVDVVQFVPVDQVDPTYVDKTYFLEAEGPGAKPYVLLRDALERSGQVAIVKVTIRTREQLAMIRPVDGVLRMHTMLWPDEVRDGEFAEPPVGVTVSDAEVEMAQSFIDALAGDFDPGAHSDAYRSALEEVIESKLSGMPAVETDADEGPARAEVVDLVAALRASVEAARARRAEAAEGAADADEEAPPRHGQTTHGQSARPDTGQRRGSTTKKSAGGGSPKKAGAPKKASGADSAQKAS